MEVCKCLTWVGKTNLGMLLALDIVGGFESRSVSPKKRKFLAGAALGLRLLRFKLELVSLCPFTDTCSCVARESK